MSATVAKASRRDLRRAVGSEAVDLLSAHDQQIRVQMGQIAAMGEELARHERRCVARSLVSERESVARKAIDATFLTRVKYLLFGAPIA